MFNKQNNVCVLSGYSQVGIYTNGLIELQIVNSTPTDIELLESIENSNKQIDNLDQQLQKIEFNVNNDNLDSFKQYHNKLMKMRKQRKEMVCTLGSF